MKTIHKEITEQHSLLKHGYEKILSVFYNDKSAKIHLREIARKTNLNENSVSRFLKHLEDAKILAAKNDGNLKKFELVNNQITWSIMAHFDILRINSIPSLRKKAIFYFIDTLKEKPIIAVLFGSTAKNTYSKQSDIDLLLIVNKIINTSEVENYVDAQTAMKISCFQIPFIDFKDEIKLKKDNLIQSAITSGYPVTNHIEYYRMIYNERI